jgi:hypothetical protein
MSKRSKKATSSDVVEIPDPDITVASLPAVRATGFAPAANGRTGGVHSRAIPPPANRNRWAARLNNGALAPTAKKVMLSDTLTPEFKPFADDLQLKSESGLVLMLTDCVVTHYLTQFPGSLTIVANVSEEQFGDEIRSQYGDIVYQTLFHSDAQLPINFPFASSPNVPYDCIGLKFKISQDKLDAFPKEDDSMDQGWQVGAVCDLVIIPTCYPPFGNQPKPGISFKVARVTVHDTI